MDDFEAAMAAKVAAPEEGTTEPEEVETAAEETPEAIAETVEPEVEAEGEQPEQAERPDWLPSNFKNVEAYVESLKHKTELFDQQANELGELRKVVQEAMEQPEPQQFGSVREALEEDPEQVVYYAHERKDERLLDAALTAWQQRAIDEGDAVSLRRANAFERRMDMARFQQSVTEQLLPPIQEFQQDAEKRSQVAAGRELMQKYPDFQEVVESAQDDPSLIEGMDFEMFGQLQQTNPVAAGEFLYRWIAGGRRQAEAATSEQKREAESQRKREATVATSSSSPAERTTKDPKEQLKEYMLTPEPHSVHHGLVRE